MRHYCIMCKEFKTNEQFSGNGHRTHICKKCSKLTKEIKRRNRILQRLCTFQLPLSKKKTRKEVLDLTNDSDIEVQNFAKYLLEPEKNIFEDCHISYRPPTDKETEFDEDFDATPSLQVKIRF